MTFISLTYFLFLPTVLLLYWLAPGRRGQNAVLVVASYVFYGWWDYRFLALLTISIGLDYSVGRALTFVRDPRRRKLLITASVSTNLAMLGFFKYFGFFTASLAAAAEGLGIELSPITLNVVLPVGISFYTFQTLSYTIDVYRGQLRACTNIIDFAAYVSFFPQLVAGPIERGTHMIPQFEGERRFDVAAAAEGCRLLLWGLFKKAAVADNLALVVNAVFDDPGGASAATLALAVVAFAFQIYCDFSAYSDMAVGSARFFGIRLMRNFAYPYFSQSITEFWRRWHISLSSWFRDYVFIPLGGSRRGRARSAWNLLLTFTLSGLWHGAAWNFVVWGALNGLALAVPVALGLPRRSAAATDLPGGTHALPTPVTVLRMLATFTFICLTWVFFRAPDWSTAMVVLERIVSGAAGYSIVPLGAGRAFALLTALLLIEWLQRDKPDVLRVPHSPWLLRLGLCTLVLWAAIVLTPPYVSSFIYFQF